MQAEESTLSCCSRRIASKSQQWQRMKGSKRHLVFLLHERRDSWPLAQSQDGLEVGASATIEQLIQAFQADDSAPAWQQAAKHLLRIAGE